MVTLAGILQLQKHYAQDHSACRNTVLINNEFKQVLDLYGKMKSELFIPRNTAVIVRN